MRTGRFFVIVFTLLFPLLGQAEVFKYTDEKGAIAFTDNIENVPEDQRPKVQEAAPPPLQTVQMLADSPTNRSNDRWIDHPLSKYIIAFIILSIGMLYIQYKSENFLLRLAAKFLFIAFLGAAIYSVLFTKERPINPAGVQKGAEPFLPTTQAREAVKKMEEAQKRQEAAMESLLRE